MLRPVATSVRLLTRGLFAAKPRRPRSGIRFNLDSLESRVQPGSVFHGLAGGSLIDPIATMSLVAGEAALTPVGDASPIERAAGNPPTGDLAQTWTFETAYNGSAAEADVVSASGPIATAEPLAAGPDSMDLMPGSLPSFEPPVLPAASTDGGGSAGGPAGYVPAGPEVGPAGESVNVRGAAGSPEAPTAPTGSSVTAATSARHAAGGAGAKKLPAPVPTANFILSRHGQSATGQSLSSRLAPKTVLDRLAGSSTHAHRPAAAIAAATKAPKAPAGLRKAGKHAASATGLAGSKSPTQVLKTNGAIRRAQGKGRGTSPPSAHKAPRPGHHNPPAPVGKGGSHPGPRIVLSGGSGSSQGPINDTLTGNFTFTLTMRGTDAQGEYVLAESGTGSISNSDVDGTTTGTGTVTFTATVHRGPGEPTADDPTTNESATFDPNGNGLLLGFDIDAYNQSTFGLARSSASSYVLDAVGADQFSDDEAETDTTSETNGPTDTDQIDFQDSGGDQFHVHIEGDGQSLAQTFDDTENATYNEGDQGSDEETGSQSLDDSTNETDGGTDGETDHITGTYDANNDFHLGAFHISESTNDTFDDSDSGSEGDTQTGDVEADQFTDRDHGTLSETVVLDGTGDNYTLTLDSTADDTIDYTDAGTENIDSSTGGGADSDRTAFNDSGHGTAHTVLHLTGTGDSNNFQETGESVTVHGTDDYSDSDAETLAETNQSNGDNDHSADQATSTDAGENQFDMTISSSDGQTCTLSESESVVDDFTDGDQGTDSWDDPETNSEGINGMEDGSDQFSDSDQGHETESISTAGTVDASGNFDLTNFTATVGGNDTTQSGDSGSDSFDHGADDTTDDYSDSDTGTDGFGLSIQDNGTTTTVTSDDTANVHGTDSDESDTTWDDPAGGQSSPEQTGTEDDTHTDNTTPTVVTHAVGSLDEEGEYSETSAAVDIHGPDTFTDHDVDSQDAIRGADDDHLSETDTSGGTDTEHLIETRTPGGGLTIDASEGTDEHITLNETENRTGGAETASGTEHLTGKFKGDQHQTGQTDASGNFKTNPATGHDDVTADGTLHHTDTKTTPGNADPNGKYGSFDWVGTGFGAPLAALIPATTAITVTNDDPALHLVAKDTEGGSNSAWSPTSITYTDKPKTTTEKVYTFANYLNGGGQTVQASGTIKYKTVTTNILSESGDGSDVGGSDGSTVAKTGSWDVTFDLPYGPGHKAGNTHWSLADTKTDTVTGDEAIDGSESLTDVESDHRVETLNESLNWDSHQYPNGVVVNFGGTNAVTNPWDETSTSTDVDGTKVVVAADGHGTFHADVTQSATGPGGGYMATGFTDTPRTLALQEDGTVTDTAPEHHVSDRIGTDPVTGADVTWHYDSTDPSTWPDDRDWFQKCSDFGAGMADTLTGGLTQNIREAAGYDDVVDKNSTAYKAGEVAGTVLDVALTPVNPCGKVKFIKYAVKGLSAAQAAGHTVAAGQALADGDYVKAGLSLMSARMSAAKLNKACFTAGTPILVEGGSKPIEALKSYEEFGDECDRVLSRDQHDPAGLVRPQRVLQAFVRVSPVLNLHVGGRIIGTTAEHPFYVEGFGWKAAGELRIGDRLLGLGERAMPVEGVADSGRVETVYNVEVEDDHTYFVGDSGWGFAVWVHNNRMYAGPRTANWRPKSIGDPACQAGCERVAKRIKKLIGGEIHTITPPEGASFLGKYRDHATGWASHQVVVKNGKVYDAFTGGKGAKIAEFKALWEHADVLKFGF